MIYDLSLKVQRRKAVKAGSFFIEQIDVNEGSLHSRLDVSAFELLWPVFHVWRLSRIE